MKNSLEQKEIRRWWNSKRQKRWEKIYKGNTYGALKLNNRMKKILNNVEQINKKKVKILELGFGGGDLAYNLIKKGHEYTGIDISKNLVNAAKKKCKKLKNKKYKFICGSIDKNLAFQSNHFDIVIVCGVMQYITKPLKTFSEIFRVLKKNCYFICVQSNFLMLRNFLNFKSFLNRIICLVLDEKYEVSSSFRSLLLETKLKKFFQGKIKKKIATSKFCNKNYVKVNFKFKKRIIHQNKITKFGQKVGFYLIKTDSSSPFFMIGKKNKFLFIINKILEFFSEIIIFSFLKKFNNSFIIIFKK